MIWFLRHGDAEDTTPDDDRRLTEEGEQQSRAAGNALAALGVEFEACLSSPKARALATAQLACEALGVEPSADERLRGGDFDAADLASGYDQVLLVGHEPDLSKAIGAITGGVADMKKGGLAAVDGRELKVLLRPKEIRRIATTLD